MIRYGEVGAASPSIVKGWGIGRRLTCDSLRAMVIAMNVFNIAQTSVTSWSLLDDPNNRANTG